MARAVKAGCPPVGSRTLVSHGSGRRGDLLLVASLPEGSPRPKTTKIGYPYVAKSSQLLVITDTGMLAARPEELRAAITHFGTSPNRPQ
jgi:hypothetical protein